MPDSYCHVVVICFQTLDLRSLITTSGYCYPLIDYVVICFQTLDLRSLITTVVDNCNAEYLL